MFFESPERTERGAATSKEIMGVSLPTPDTPYTEAALNFVFAEVWSRPGLDRRSRRWITLSAVCASGSPAAIEAYLRVTLASDDITEAELREFVLQFSVFQGFPKGATVELTLNRIIAEQAAK